MVCKSLCKFSIIQHLLFTMLFVYAYLLQRYIKSIQKQYKAQKTYLIIMQEPIPCSRHHLQIDQEDLQALDLFNNLQHEVSKSQQPIQPNQQLHESHHSEDDHPRLNRLSKLKHSSKKQKKHKKLKQKHKLKKKKHRNIAELSSPKKKIKRDKSQKKQNDQEEQVLRRDEDQGSSQFDSQSNNSDLNDELRNLNPDYAQNEQDQSPKKRLIKSGRKQRIQQKEGFKIQQLGNDAQLHLSNESDESFDGIKRKKLKAKKLKMKVPTNQQIMNAFKEHGVLESEGEDEAGKDRQYDSGLDMLNSLKSKKNSSGIRINNRLFGDLEMNLQKQQVQMPLPQNLQLELKPKVSVSSQRFSFLSRAETIKKQRGLEADVKHQQFQRRAQEKAKKSMAKVVSSMVSQEFHDDIDVEIRVPTIARGKSAGIINNTVFLRKFANKFEGNQGNLQSQVPLIQTKSVGPSNMVNKDIKTRSDFFKEIQQQNRLRRSKYISQEELKNSFKKTNLEELEQARKRIQEKKRKQVLSDQSENQQQIDSNLQQMIEKEEMVCGDIQQPEQHEGEQPQQEQAQEVKISVEVQVEKIPQNQIENKQGLPSDKDQGQILNQELQQYKEVIQQLQSVSDDEQKLSEEKEEQEQSENMQNEEEVQQAEQENEQQEQVNNAEIVPQIDERQNQENERVMRQLQEQGIINRKRGINKQKIIQQNPIENQNQTPAKDAIQNDQNIMHEDKHNVELVSTDKKYQYQQNEEFNEFRKLRKIASVIAKKRKQREQGRQYAAQFVQHEAQEGSDNQEHDDFVKKIDYDAEERQYEGIDLDADLEQLIDNAVDLNEEDQNQAFRKYLQDVRQKDREEIKKIIRGEFHKKHQDLQLEMEQDQKKRLERMQEVMNWMKQREEQQGQNLYLKQPEPQQNDSQDQSSDFDNKKKKKVQQEQEEQKVDYEEEQARLEKFLSQTMPSSKKELKPAKELNFLPLPESVKFQKRPSNQKAISMSKLGSKVVHQINSHQLLSRKNTSSLVNKILNKNSQFKPKPLLAVTTKPTKKK